MVRYRTALNTTLIPLSAPTAPIGKNTSNHTRAKLARAARNEGTD